MQQRFLAILHVQHNVARVDKNHVYNAWAMVRTPRGKLEPIIPGNTNEIVNAAFRTYAPSLRSHINENFEIKRYESAAHIIVSKYKTFTIFVFYLHPLANNLRGYLPV